MLLIDVFFVVDSDFFYAIQDPLPKGSTDYSGLGPPTSISNEKNTLPTGQSDGGSFLINIPSQMNLVCFKQTGINKDKCDFLNVHTLEARSSM